MEYKKRDLVKKAVGKKTACYVLVSCEEPSSSGEMKVELTYEGDETLACFLMENAQVYFDDKLSEIAEGA